MRDSLPSYLPEQLLCDHESAGGPKVTQVRGTVLVSSLQVLREAGHYERYLEQLPEVWREQVLYLIALSWVPVEVAIAHYAACEALGLPDRQLEEIGELRRCSWWRIPGAIRHRSLRCVARLRVGRSLRW